MGCFSSGSEPVATSTATTTTNNLIPGQQSALTSIWDQAKQNYNAGPPAYYPGNPIAPQSGDTTSAMDMVRNRATSGSPLNTAAQNQLTGTLGGQYSGQYQPGQNPFQNYQNNPYSDIGNSFQDYDSNPFMNADNPFSDYGSNPELNNALDYAMGKARTGIDAQFSGSGRYGSGLHKNALAETFGGITSGVMADQYNRDKNIAADQFSRDRALGAAQYGQDRQTAADEQYRNRALGADVYKTGLGVAADQYAQDRTLGANVFDAERQRQIQAAQLAPALAATDYNDASQLGTVGMTQDKFAQDQINADILRHNYNATAPQDQLAKYLGMVTGNYGGSATTQQPIYQNQGAGALGGGMAGYNLAGGFSDNPWVKGGGALLGGLLGGGYF